MLRSKKFIFITVLAVAVLMAGSIVGVALAQTSSTSPAAKITSADLASGNNSMMARVAKILNIDQKKLEDAYKQAGRDARQEALDSYLKAQVAAGKIGQIDADKYSAWAKSQPTMPSGFGFPGMRMSGRWGR